MNFKSFITNIVGFFTANPIFILGIALAVGLFFGITIISRGCESRKVEKIKGNIQESKSNAAATESAANVIANFSENQKEVIKNAEINTNFGRNAVNNTIQRDSNSFSGNYREAKRKYCAENPSDSACR